MILASSSTIFSDLLLRLAALGGGYFVGIWVGVIFHELGHVIGSMLTRMRVFHVSFGGKNRVKWRLGRTNISLDWHPLPGFVSSYPSTLSFYRFRMLICVLAGPVATFIYEALLIWWMFCADIPQSPTEAAILRGFLYANSVLTISVMIPGMVKIPAGEIASDALQTWHLLTKPLPSPETHQLTFRTFEKLYRIGSYYDVSRGRAKAPKHGRTPLENLPLQEQGLCLSMLLTLEEWAQIREISERILADATIPRDAPIRCQASDSYASSSLYEPDAVTALRAVEILEASIKDFPESVTLKGTLGGLLFEMGRIDEAEQTLNEVIANSTAAIDQGISSAYLARIAQSRGLDEKAREYADAAKKHSGEMPVVKRILAELR